MKAISSIRVKKNIYILGIQPISRYARHFKMAIKTDGWYSRIQLNSDISSDLRKQN